MYVIYYPNFSAQFILVIFGNRNGILPNTFIGYQLTKVKLV